MNIQRFRGHIATESQKRESIYEACHQEIKAGSFIDAEQLWQDRLLVQCTPNPENSAKIIFPGRVNILMSSIFYDRVYVDIDDYTEDYQKIDNKDTFLQHYQISHNDFLQLIETGRVVPIFPIGIERSSDFILKELIFPLVTRQLPHLTFEGYSLICQTWQVKKNALPDPDDRTTWGFLMDLCGAMGIGANLIRPEWKSEIWERRDLIFGILGIDEITGIFHDQDISLADFFISTGIDYDSRIPVSEYLNMFDKIDKNRIFSLYKSLNKDDFYSEVNRVNSLSKRVSSQIDRQNLLKIAVSAPATLLYHFISEVFWNAVGGPIAKVLKKTTDQEFASIIVKHKSEIVDKITSRWQSRPEWLKEDNFPEVLELTKVKRLLEKRQA